MKRMIPLVLILAVLLTACGSGSKSDWQRDQEYKLEARYEAGYEDGYEEGYREGYSDAEFDIDDFSFYEHPELLEEAKWRLEEEASDYVREKGGWTPEEAMEIIDAYENRKPFWQDGSPPSFADYREAVRSLYYFYDYFY